MWTGNIVISASSNIKSCVVHSESFRHRISERGRSMIFWTFDLLIIKLVHLLQNWWTCPRKGSFRVLLEFWQYCLPSISKDPWGDCILVQSWVPETNIDCLLIPYRKHMLLVNAPAFTRPVEAWYHIYNHTTWHTSNSWGIRWSCK